MKLQRPANFFLSLLAMAGFLLISCAKKTSQPAAVPIEKSFPPPKVTVLADLPDSLQPKVTYLKDVPPPVIKEFTIPTPSKVFRDSVSGLIIPPYAQGRGFFKNYTIEDGLCNDMVFSAFTDKKGNIWFGTYNGGISRYDGKVFTNFTIEHGLASNTVWKIIEDSKGNLWFATNGGVSRYDGSNFTNFTTAEGLPHDDVGSVIEDHHGHFWFTTLGGGISRYDGKTFTNYSVADGLPTMDVWFGMKDKKGNLWFGTRRGGVIRCDFSATGKTVFTKFEGPESWTKDVVTFIKEDRAGHIWFSTQRNGLWRFDGVNFTNYTKMDGLGCSGSTNIFEDHAGTMWVGGCNGVSRFNGKTFTTYSTKQGLAHDYVVSITEDKSSNLWFGTYGGGVSCFKGIAVTNFLAEHFGADVSAIMEDQRGHYWITTAEDGLIWYDEEAMINLTTAHGIKRNSVQFLREFSDGKLWFTTYYGGGVTCMEVAYGDDSISEVTSTTTPSLIELSMHKRIVRLTNYSAAQGLAFDAAYGVMEDTPGNLWVATYGGGISRFDQKSFTSYSLKQGLASDDVFDIEEDSKGGLWIFYVGASGISYFNGTSISNFTTAQGLSNNTCWSFLEDSKGNLWFGTNSGLDLIRKEKREELERIIYQQDTFQTPIFESFSTSDGLPSDYINEFEMDQDGNVYVCSNGGLTILRGGLDAFSNPGAIENYNHDSGYPLYSTGGMIIDSKDKLWIATGSIKTGMVRMDPDKLMKNQFQPVVTLEQVKINNEDISWHRLLSVKSSKENIDNTTMPAYTAEELHAFKRGLTGPEQESLIQNFGDIHFDSVTKWHPIPTNLVLPFRHNDITFHFNAIVTDKNHLVKYQYILEGYDDHWSPATNQASVTYGNISEGHYTFILKACSPEGIWSEPITYSFSVLPPIHRTWWAYLLYSVLFLSTLYIIHRYQQRRTILAEQEKAKQKQAILNERLRISRDLHDEVGATLSGISMYSHIAKEQIKTESRDVVMSSLNVMQESASDMVNKLNDIVWLLNPDKAQLHQLVDKLETYARQMAQIKGIHVNVQIPDSLASIELPLEVRRNIYLVFKEAINNALKYSQANTLTLSVSDFDHSLEFILIDDGVGFDPQTIQKGNGLDNLIKRAKEIGALIKLDSSPGTGTRLSLTYTLPT